MNRPALLSLVLLASSAPLAPAAEPTYTKDVVPILQNRCQGCHRPGQVAPFSLLTFDQARKRSHDVASVVSEKRMPPWHPSTEEGGPFRDVRALTSQEIATLAAWDRAGAPQGHPEDAPPARAFPSEWSLGPPDLVLKPSESFKLSASGPDEFRVFVIPTDLAEGKWIRAVDFRPGNTKVVHHILAAYDMMGVARRMDARDPLSGYRTTGGFGLLPTGGMDGWSPGNSPTELPDGVARYLPKGADFLLQIHYHKSGKPEDDQTQVGLYFAKTPADKQLRGMAVFPPRKGIFFRPDLVIPAGASAYEVSGEEDLSFDAHVISAIPHMHWLGKDFRMWAETPDGSKIPLITIPQWDFNWQDAYTFEKPVALPKGSKIRMLAHFDNSSDNPANPRKPPTPVHWGEGTDDEMCIGFLQLTRDEEHLKGRPPGRFRADR